MVQYVPDTSRAANMPEQSRISKSSGMLGGLLGSVNVSEQQMRGLVGWRVLVD